MQKIWAFVEKLRHAQASGIWDDVFETFTDLARELVAGQCADLILWADASFITPERSVAATRRASSPTSVSSSPRSDFGRSSSKEQHDLRYELRWQDLDLGVLTIQSPAALDVADGTAKMMFELAVDQFCAYWGSLIKEQALSQPVETHETLEIVQSIGEVLTTSLDVESVLNNITDTLQAIFNAEACAVLVYEPEISAFRCAASTIQGSGDGCDIVIPAGESIVGWVAKQPTALFLNDVNTHPFFNPRFDGHPDLVWRDMLTAPLRYRDEAIGVIEIINKIGGRFDELDVQLLQRVIPGAAIALENARLFEKIFEEKQKAELILQRISRGVCVLDINGVILRLNPAGEDLLGVTEGAALGQKLCEIVPSEELEEMCPGDELCPICRETKGEGPDGTTELNLVLSLDDSLQRRLSVSIAPLMGSDARRRGAVVVMRDVTAEWEEQRLQVEFLAVASHGLRSPLMSITTAAEWVLARSGLDTPAQERIREIQKQAFTLSEFVGELLDVTQIESGQLRIYTEPVSLLPFARQAVKTFRLRAPNHQIRLYAPPKLPFVLADANKLDIILDHLLDNAVHYSPAGSEIAVEIEPVEKGALIRVIDQGVGIPADHLPYIFDRFNRGARHKERKTRGLGLGLYIVRRLVEGQDGTIWVESAEGQGSKFSFILPWFDQERAEL